MKLTILAQVTDSLLEGFISQIPTSLVIMVCGSGLLLFVAFAWFAYFKPLRNKRREIEQARLAQNPAPKPVQPEAMMLPPVETSTQDAGLLDDDDDLPDLGLLMGDEIIPQAVVIPEPAPVIPVPKPEPVIEPTPAPVRALSPRLSTGHSFNGEPVLNILRDQRDGRLVVVIDGVAYRSLAEDEGLKKQFVNVMRDLNQVVTQPDNNPPTEDVMPVIKPEPYLGDQVPGKLPSFKMEDNMTPTNKGHYEVTAVPELNLAKAIEAYLQHKIHNTPDYRGRVIHVLPAIGGGVRIQVDNDYYEAVSDVTDADVREFIQEAIQEWQKLNS